MSLVLLYYHLTILQHRNAAIDSLIGDAKKAIEARGRREAAEAGRRQKEMVPLEYPEGLGAPKVVL